jgi:hypothetical protein
MISTPVTFHEQTLRDLIASPYGQTCGRAFIDSVETGHVLTVVMTDGRTVVIEKPIEAQSTLRELFGWKGDSN